MANGEGEKGVRKGRRSRTRRPASRLYPRVDRDGVARWYADLRSLGGGRGEAMKADGRRATSDREVAEKLLADRVAELMGRAHVVSVSRLALSSVRYPASRRSPRRTSSPRRGPAGLRMIGWRGPRERFDSRSSSSARTARSARSKCRMCRHGSRGYRSAPGGAGMVLSAAAHYEGETLRERIARGPLAVPEACTLAAEVAEGLSAAHATGIVHRDIKPSNILLTTDGARILDFGVAKSIDADVTRQGTRLGSVAYMSPEQTRGDAVDQRTDLWSLGVVLYEMLAGRRPFRGESDATLIHAIRNDELEPVTNLRPDVPPTGATILEACLSKDASARFARATVTIWVVSSWRGWPWSPRTLIPRLFGRLTGSSPVRVAAEPSANSVTC